MIVAHQHPTEQRPAPPCDRPDRPACTPPGAPLRKARARADRLAALVQVRTAHACSMQRRTRFTRTNVTARPTAGRSRTRTGRRRSCTARAPRHPGIQPPFPWSRPLAHLAAELGHRRSTKPANPNITVAALPFSSTCGFPFRVPSTTNVQAPGRSSGRSSRPCRQPITAFH